MSEILLRSERLVLRRFTTADVDLLVELDADPQVMRYINGGHATPREQIAGDVLPAWLAWYERAGGHGFWAAIERRSGEFLGWFHLRPGRGVTDDEPELGYRLRAAAWGRGLATEGSRALVDLAFARLGARRVTGSTMAVNQASRRVLEKVGMRVVRSFHAAWDDAIPGGELGDVEYAITRQQWEAAS